MSMNHNDTQVGQLVINLIETKSQFDELAQQEGLNANELYLVSNDNTDPVVGVNYANSKLTYTTEGGASVDIVSVTDLKTAMSLSSVASDGSYNSLTSKPSINGIELTGNKTTSDLGISLNYSTTQITNKPSINGITLTGNLTTSDLNISYSDLDDLPTIPTVSSTYIAGNTGAALTSAGVDQALTNYVPKTRSVVGYGALSGGGELTENRRITHKNGPTGLETAAVKVGVDQYGHACLGGSITASDVGAIPLSYTVLQTGTSIDGSKTNVVIFGLQSETLGFSTTPTLGKTTTIHYINETENAISLTIPYNLVNTTYYNGQKLTANEVVSIPVNTSKRFDVLLVQSGSDVYAMINEL